MRSEFFPALVVSTGQRRLEHLRAFGVLRAWGRVRVRTSGRVAQHRSSPAVYARSPSAT